MKRLLLIFSLTAGLLVATSVSAQTTSLADTLRLLLDRDGLAAAENRYEELKRTDFAGCAVNEQALNLLGYDYLQQNKLAEALAVFRYNADRFPASSNAYDSLGEALVQQGDAAGAREAYRRALVLEPANRNAEAMLAELSRPDGFTALQQQLKLGNDLMATMRLEKPDRQAVLPALRARLDRYLHDYPGAKAAPGLVGAYFRVVESVDLSLAADAWRSFLNHPDAGVAELAARKQPLAAAIVKPLELRFADVNGESVDLARFRGKVVLVDFWATWCGPCIAELPNIKEVYASYHEHGFEIVGIALENGRLVPGDAPAMAAAKLAAAKKILTDFTAKNAMPWPQYFDGKWWQNDISSRFAIESIPAMFLLDQEGRIVSTDARGAKLGAEVRRLLKLQP